MKFDLYVIKRKDNGQYLQSNLDKRNPVWGDTGMMWKTIDAPVRHLKWLSHEHMWWPLKIRDKEWPRHKLGKEIKGEIDKYQVEIWKVKSASPPRIIEAKELLRREISEREKARINKMGER